MDLQEAERLLPLIGALLETTGAAMKNLDQIISGSQQDLSNGSMDTMVSAWPSLTISALTTANFLSSSVSPIGTHSEFPSRAGSLIGHRRSSSSLHLMTFEPRSQLETHTGRRTFTSFSEDSNREEGGCSNSPKRRKTPLSYFCPQKPERCGSSWQKTDYPDPEKWSPMKPVLERQNAVHHLPLHQRGWQSQSQHFLWTPLFASGEDLLSDDSDQEAPNAADSTVSYYTKEEEEILIKQEEEIKALLEEEGLELGDLPPIPRTNSTVPYDSDEESTIPEMPSLDEFYEPYNQFDLLYNIGMWNTNIHEATPPL